MAAFGACGGAVRVGVERIGLMGSCGGVRVGEEAAGCLSGIVGGGMMLRRTCTVQLQRITGWDRLVTTRSRNCLCHGFMASFFILLQEAN